MENNPKLLKESFICPHCKVLAKQDWLNSSNLGDMVADFYRFKFFDYRKSIDVDDQKAIENFLEKAKTNVPRMIVNYFPKKMNIAKCHSCTNYSIWVANDIVYPRNISIEAPNSDMNEDIQELYNEAASIFLDSPKGATAILRLALQKLLIQMGKTGKKINNDIKELVSDGLNPKMQKALDTLRVVGNNAVHPGQIDLDDNKHRALQLFKVLNMIADDMITKPKAMNDLYDDIIPDETKGHIDQRDGRQ
ncbi:MAG: DUF4145 domain-containing protein [Sulfurovum sp.]|nr:DUF4145 domain-containing protein [Sulfurovum sp.]